MSFEYENQRNKFDEQLQQKSKLNQILLQSFKENNENLEKLKEDVRTLTVDSDNINKERQNLNVKLNQGIEEVHFH
jgi:chromosome segregation ATPase